MSENEFAVLTMLTTAVCVTYWKQIIALIGVGLIAILCLGVYTIATTLYP